MRRSTSTIVLLQEQQQARREAARHHAEMMRAITGDTSQPLPPKNQLEELGQWFKSGQFAKDALLTIVTGGLWLIWMIVRPVLTGKGL